MALMVPTIGPIELLDKLDIKKPRLVTVSKEKLAKTKAPTYLHKTSDCSIKTT